MKITFLGHVLFRRSFFYYILELCRAHHKKAKYSSRNKSKKAPKKKMFFQEKLGFISKSWGKSPFCGRESQVFDKSMKDRGSMCEHFPLRGSAWAAIWGRLLKKQFSDKKTVFGKFDVLGFFRRVVLGVSEEIFVGFVGVLAWNRDGKWWDGVN